jgi:hypothetical protein
MNIRQRVLYHPPGCPRSIITDGVIVAIEGDAVTIWKYMDCYDAVSAGDIVEGITPANDPDAAFENAQAGRLASGDVSWRERNGG